MSSSDIFKENRDELTGLLDKPAFYEWGQDLINDADEDSSYAFIFLDMENFKQFNANYGFEKGDELLKNIANILQLVFENQLVSRFSGDHFVVCTEIPQVVPAILEVKKRVKELQKDVNLELKAGVYIYNGEIKDVIRCCDRARVACASIKKKYDIDYKFYDDELGGHLARKQFIIDNLVEALANRYIQVFYQPIVRGLTGNVCGWEALVRWIDPNRGTVYPNEFISVLEEYHLIHKLDCFVMEEVVSTFAKMEKEGMKEAVPVSINLSRIDFEIIDIASYMDELISKYQVNKDLFRLEITESALTTNPDFIREQISRIRKCGYRVWMDDFGSGYSSLNILKDFDFDLVKIDMEFLRGFDVNDNGKIILKHTVSMLKSLGFHTLAEGVETEEQYHFLRGLGCELVQGYFIGRPMQLDQGCELMNSDGRGFEDGNERHFYNNLGRIDILKQNPLKNLHNDYADALPLAIGIVKDGYWTFAYANKAYMDTISSNNNVTLQVAEEMINSGSFRWGEANMLWDLCDQSKRSGAPESIEFVDNGKIINMRVRHVSSDEVLHIDAYLVSVRVLTHYLNESHEEKINSVSKYMLTFYECVDLFGINTPYFENIYLYNSKVHINELNLDSRSVIEMIATEKVHDDDRQAFRQFMDLDTIEERISQSRNGIIEGFFNIKDIYDKYELKVVTLRIIQINNNRAILSCVVPVSKFITNKLHNNEPLTRTISVEDNTVDDLTAYNILNLLPVGIFWKDQRRRFIGANKMFLDYYNLSSINAILGKTDEDMGWHIDPEPFKKDELRIINEGHIINNVEGECIVQGQVRKILATKRPFIVDGRIVGLVGYFKDVTEDVQKSGEMEKKASTDPLTGLFNRRGFDEILPKYIEQFEKEHVDFAVLIMDVDRFKQVNDMYGHNFGDAVLKTVSEKLKRIAGESSVVARIGGDEFILLHQLKNVSEINSIIQEIDINISRIESIENEKFKLSLSKGFALYSEHLDIKRTIDAADKNMYSEKKHHSKSSDKPIDRF